MHTDPIHITYMVLFLVSGTVSSFANNQARAALNREAVLQLSAGWQIQVRSWPTKRVVFPEAQKFLPIRNYTTAFSFIMFAAFIWG